MQNNSQQPKLILASSSPRRKQLLENSGIDFAVVVSHIEEKQKPNETAREYVTRNAKEKALAVNKQLTGNEFVLSADTIVINQGGLVLEKPLNSDHAFEMLSSLSDQSHLVYTAYALYQNQKECVTRVIETTVHFRKLGEQEILSYIATKEPFDKAGAYGIQGFAMGFVDRIEGSYTNVMGLPLSHVLVDLSFFAKIGMAGI